MEKKNILYTSSFGSLKGGGQRSLYLLLNTGARLMLKVKPERNLKSSRQNIIVQPGRILSIIKLTVRVQVMLSAV